MRLAAALLAVAVGGVAPRAAGAQPVGAPAPAPAPCDTSRSAALCALRVRSGLFGGRVTRGTPAATVCRGVVACDLRPLVRASPAALGEAGRARRTARRGTAMLLGGAALFTAAVGPLMVAYVTGGDVPRWVENAAGPGAAAGAVLFYGGAAVRFGAGRGVRRAVRLYNAGLTR